MSREVRRGSRCNNHFGGMREPVTIVVIVALAALAPGPGKSINRVELIGTQRLPAGGNDFGRLPTTRQHGSTPPCVTKLLGHLLLRRA